MAKNYTIVSDPGVDDMVALALLYKLDPNANNVLISTFGNAAERITAVNAQEFIGFVAKSWRFAHGSALPLNGVVERPWPDYFHGPDAAWGVHPLAGVGAVREASAATSSLISLATLTDPLALIRKGGVKEVTLMGGAFEIEGNETKFAETNMAFDPDAAHHFFAEAKDIEVKVVPLDVTRQVFWSHKQVKEIPENNPVNIWLKRLVLAWFDNYNHAREKDFNLHDPLAVYLEFFPEKAIWTESGVEVIALGERRGQTVFSKTAPPCKTALRLGNAAEIAADIYRILFLDQARR